LSYPMSEAAVLAGCKHLLELLRNEGLLVWKRISTTGIPVGDQTRRAIFVKNPAQGMADIMVFLKSDPPKTLHIELKSKTGRLSEAQEKWRDELKAMGHDTYYLVRSVQELEKVLIDNGVVHWSLNRRAHECAGD